MSTPDLWTIGILAGMSSRQRGALAEFGRIVEFLPGGLALQEGRSSDFQNKATMFPTT
jgi:hypothetical protein